MKIDSTKAKKCVTEVPADCKVLIDKLLEIDDEDLQELLSNTSWWTVGKCELYHWVDVLNRFDSILQAATLTSGSEWSLSVNTDERLQNLTLCVLHFTSLLIEYSFSRHLYNSMEHLVTLLSSSNLDIILSVLNLLYVFSKRSNFLSRLSDKQRLPLLKKLGYLAENWGGKENGFGLADAAKDLPKSAYPRNATTLHYEFYSEPSESGRMESVQSTVYCIHIENVDEFQSNPAEIMESLLEMYPVPEDKKMLLYTHLRLAHSFSKRDLRLRCVQARLHAISVLVYMNSLQTSASNIPNILYNGFIEELVDILQVSDTNIVDIKAAALRTLTSIVHLECRDRTPRVGTVVDATGVAQYHGFLPVLVRRCIKKMTEKNSDPGPPEFTPNFTTALFSFLYHLSSYENGGEALVQSGMMAPLLNVVITMGDQQEQTTFVTRAVRVVDLITNVEWQAFQGLGGLQIFISRLKHEVDLCRNDTTNGKRAGMQCLPQRAALFKSILNFLKKAISDHVFGEEVRHIMDGSLPDSLKHLVENVEYYGASLFLLAMEVVTVYVFQEPSLLSVLQENGITDAMLNALLVKDPPATREVLASLPNVFSALCLNARGLESFVNHKPFDRLFKVMLSPNYLLAMRTRRGSSPVDRDTASNLGNAMDELMRHQPTLRTDAMKAIIELLRQLKAMGHDPNTVCTKLAPNKSETSGPSSSTPFEAMLGGGEDTESEDEDAAASRKPAALAQTFVASESKQLVPLLDYIHNVMRFIQAIVSNNATDDHCQEFQTHEGLPVLFQLLHLPALPIDFPSSSACQSVSNLVKSILTLSKKAQVFTDGLAEFNIILTRLETMYSPVEVERDENLWDIANGSIVLYELASAPPGTDPSDIPLIHTLAHAHAFVMVFLHISRTSQNDIRSLLVSGWASEDGLGILARLNKLYCTLIWEATMLMTFCPKNEETDVCEAAARLRAVLLAKSNLQSKGKDAKQKGEAMEEDVKNVGPWNTFQKAVRSVVLTASRLGRSMAELFGLLAKLSIGIPLRQRYRHNIPYYPAPARAASYTVAGKLSDLLQMGMQWSLPCQRQSAQYKISFLNCTIGFTTDMLFDERKYAYHLMLQYFQQSGTFKSFFQCFEWALNAPSLEKKPDLPADLCQAVTLDVFCQIWLGLLERLVNPRNVLESPHTITDRSSPSKEVFDATKFLLEVHVAAVDAFRTLWSNNKLQKMSTNPHSCDTILLILSNLIQGEKLIKKKLKKSIPHDAGNEVSVPPPLAVTRVMPSHPAAEANPQDSQYFQQLVDMGFSRASATEALMHTHTLEAATEWILSHSEDMELMQAITMSLESSSPAVPAAPAVPAVPAMPILPVVPAMPALPAIPTLPAVPALPQPDKNEDKTDKEMQPAGLDQPGTSKEWEPAHDRYLSGKEMDSFIDDILQCCLTLLDSFPNSVYRVYEVFEAIMKRNGPEWTGEKNIFDNLLKEIGESCDFLLSSSSSGLANSALEAHKRLSSRCLLLSLLFQGRQFSDLCTEALHQNHIIPKLVQILHNGTYGLVACETGKENTSDWISSTLLLIDLYERSCVYKRRLKALAFYKDYSRTWKWFDDRSGRWCTYSPTNQKILNDAYKEGASKIQFTAGRRRYNVNFQQMIQVNEESGNRRPIIVMFNKPKKPGTSESKTSVTSEPEKEASDSTMETDFCVSKQNEDLVWQGLTEEQALSLLRSCTALLKFHVRGDTVHAAMRLLLRLTRSDKPGGHERAVAFVRIEGPQALLDMTKRSEFSGFASLATLIFCHFFEDTETLKYAMEKTVKIAATRGVPNQSSGVSVNTIGNREMYYVLQALAPMACRHPETFVDICKNNFRIAMPNSKTSHIEEEESRMMNNTTVQILELVKDPNVQSKPKPALSSMMKHLLQLLLTALIRVEGSRFCIEGTIGKQHSKSASSVLSMARHLRQNDEQSVAADDMHRRYSESEAASIREEERAAALRQNSVAPDLEERPQSSQEMVDVFYPSEPQESGAAIEKPEADKAKIEKNESDTLLFSKSGILRLLAELVSSYPACAQFIVDHVYPAGISSLVKQDSSCLSYILHCLLPPSNKPDKKEGTNTNNTESKNAQNEKDCCSSLARVLITSLACCHPKQNTQIAVIVEVKTALYKILLMPESLSKHTALRAILGLVNNMIECASKMAHGNDGPMSPALVEDSTNLARVMINKGLATDLAQISNYIDLGSHNMADTVNAALKPLEVLSRLVHSSTAGTPKPSTANAKPDESEPVAAPSSQTTAASSEAEEVPSQSSADTVLIGNTATEQINDTFDLSGGSVDMIEDSNAFVIAQDDASDTESMTEDFPIAPDASGQAFSNDLLNRSTEQEVVEDDMAPMEEDDDGESVGSSDDDVDHDSSSSEEDPTEEIHNEDQELEDEGSDMDDIDDDEDDDDDDDEEHPPHLNYETFVYDLLNETSENNIMFQLEDVLSDGFLGRLPQPVNPRTSQLFTMPVTIGDDQPSGGNAATSSWQVPTVHPMLTRPARTTYSNAVRNTPGMDARPTSYTVTANGTGQTLQIEFTSNSEDAPHILTRLLGPSAAGGVIQLHNDSLYNDGGGHAQLLVNPNNIRLFPYNRDGNQSSLQDHSSSHMTSSRPVSGSLSILPTALSRWTQTSEVLEPDSTQYCLLGLRKEVIQVLESRRNTDIKERRAKRALEKEKAKESKKGTKEASKTTDNKEGDLEKDEGTSAKPLAGESDEQETHMDASAAEISTPTNTPIATRPESPAGQHEAVASADVDAIDALQQASSSLQSVSLSSNNEDEEASADVQMQQDDTGDVTVSTSDTAGTVRTVETVTLSITSIPDPEQETVNSDQGSSVDPDSAAAGPATDTPVVASAAAAAAGASAAAAINEFEGVDPSFLAALPEDIRQEVIREQLGRQGARRPGGTDNQGSRVSAEFLAALPPSIQQEILTQERVELSRAERQSTSASDPVDPTVFIQTLPSSLRQSVLADMDDSLVAVLPAELAAEAQELRANLERRQQRYIRDRLFTGHASHLFQRANIPSSFGLPSGSIWNSFHGGRSKQQSQQNVKVQVRQLLNHDSLACLLLLLFVEEPKLNMTRLHRVLRNVCFHIPTRHWLVSTLIAILQHSKESQDEEKVDAEESMDYKTTPSLLKQKPGGKQKKLSISFSSDTRNLSWLSIKLDAALGSRASIFRVVKPPRMQDIGGAKKRRYASADCSVYIHPQASPIVCRHIVDTLHMLSKFFPQHFIGTSLRPLKNESSTINQQIDTDFWDILLRLDSLSFSSDLPKKNVAEEKRVQDLASRDIELTCMGELMRMLTHPIIKRSQQLTDRLLRLLAQISLHLPTPSKTVGETRPDLKSADDLNEDGDDKKSDKSVTSPEEPNQTATMGAKASTSYTSTVRHALMDTKTATTGSTQSHGSISFPYVSQEAKTAVPLEKELELAVQILTSHACSEDGLEHATTLLFHLSKTQVKLRPIIIRLLLQGAQEIGHKLCEQVVELSEQMSKQLEEDMVLDGSTATESQALIPDDKPVSSSTRNQRSDPATLMGLTSKNKIVTPGRDLQLPIMQDLTCKTSNQAFFLRILKVIIQLRSSKKEEKPAAGGRRSMAGQGRNWQRVFGNASAFPLVRISREEQEAGETALMTILESGNHENDQTSGRPQQSSSNDAANEKPIEEEDPRSLCEKLQLEDLWDNLGKCLKQLEDSKDPHAVLVLQPTVEAFFLVHAPKQNAVKQTDLQKDVESQLSHLEMQPLSPSMNLESSSQHSQGSATKDDSLTSETKKFLDFAETHRSILNQILRQSNVALTEGPFSVLVNHTKVLDFDVKRQHFRQELERLEESSVSRRDDIAIRVRRDHVFEDSFRELHRRSKEELKSRLYIVFEGEEGQDAGGLLREWYLIISKEIFNPMYALFRVSPGDRVTYTINPLSYINSNHLSYFKFVGGIVAKAVYDNKLLDCYFTRSFYKHILGKTVRYQDMESEDYTFFQGLVYLLQNEVSSIGSEMNFSVEITEFGKPVVRDIKPNGRNIPITEENKKEYVHLVCQEKMTGSVRQQLSAFLEGFYEIIPKRLISIFDEQELELLISGLPNIDIEDLRNNTEYHKYETTSVQIQWFWRALRSFDQAERAKFLQFVTGTSKVPLQGFAHLEGMTGAQKFQIHRDSRSTSRLPSAHTCFNQLDLPAYETYDKLRHMLSLAITECQEGFGLA